jgi:hypothetical protein
MKGCKGSLESSLESLRIPYTALQQPSQLFFSLVRRAARCAAAGRAFDCNCRLQEANCRLRMGGVGLPFTPATDCMRVIHLSVRGMQTCRSTYYLRVTVVQRTMDADIVA